MNETGALESPFILSVGAPKELLMPHEDLTKRYIIQPQGSFITDFAQSGEMHVFIISSSEFMVLGYNNLN